MKPDDINEPWHLNYFDNPKRLLDMYGKPMQNLYPAAPINLSDKVDEWIKIMKDYDHSYNTNSAYRMYNDGVQDHPNLSIVKDILLGVIDDDHDGTWEYIGVEADDGSGECLVECRSGDRLFVYSGDDL